MSFWDKLKKGAIWLGKLFVGGHDIGKGWRVGVIIIMPEEKGKKKGKKSFIKRVGFGVKFEKRF